MPLEISSQNIDDIEYSRKNVGKIDYYISNNLPIPIRFHHLILLSSLFEFDSSLYYLLERRREAINQIDICINDVLIFFSKKFTYGLSSHVLESGQLYSFDVDGGDKDDYQQSLSSTLFQLITLPISYEVQFGFDRDIICAACTGPAMHCDQEVSRDRDLDYLIASYIRNMYDIDTGLRSLSSMQTSSIGEILKNNFLKGIAIETRRLKSKYGV